MGERPSADPLVSSLDPYFRGGIGPKSPRLVVGSELKA